MPEKDDLRKMSAATFQSEFHLDSVFDYLKTGIGSIIEDEVTQRFVAEELKVSFKKNLVKSENDALPEKDCLAISYIFKWIFFSFDLTHILGAQISNIWILSHSAGVRISQRCLKHFYLNQARR